ncbi:MAG: hypothetical protein HC906_03755 [Bacteroidales bacterium]|nr:hypothetical protein [Bacteroidales bacterium]
MLGQGLLLRTYEIPSSIWETIGYRVRYGFYKDVEGFMLKLNYKNFDIKLLRGNVLDVTLPPVLDDRRPDLVEAIEAKYRFKKQAFGVIAMRNTNSTTGNNFYTSFLFEGNILKKVSVYAELANRYNRDNLFSFNNDAGFGAYFSLSYSGNIFGMSAEYKHYNNFSIGTGINDPPTLVKEHPYRLLNRSTHVPELTNESGYQIETYINVAQNSTLTINTSLARNKFSNQFDVKFNEYFMEYHNQNIFKNSDAKIFLDYARDPFVNENSRWAAGGNLDIPHSKLNSLIELEYQWINREIGEGYQVNNGYFGYTLSFKYKYKLSLNVEVSDDPFLLDENETYQAFPSAVFTFRPGQNHMVSLFGGRRRGGPACNAGVCYNVLDFEGIELRVLANF